MKIHFIGIEGIGVSALAGYYLAKGHKVSGSDVVFGPHRAKNLPKDADLVIHSPAVKPDNPEIKQAKKLKIKIQTYPQALGDLTKEYFTIAVSGTHGKSTTCAMIALILMKAGLDPTVIIGTKLKEFGNKNFRPGKSKYLVIEADEWQASFLNYWPKIIVLTNIEREHLDYYKDLKHILSTYRKYIEHLSKKGVLVINEDDANIRSMLKPKSQIPNPKQIQNSKATLRGLRFASSKIQNYSIKQKEAKKLSKILKVPGQHNIYNALAALTLARELRIPDKVSFKALSEYKCVWRRFEIIKKKGVTIISDYGHHPTEVKATLKAGREKFPNKRIWCIFQPHQYQRTYYLFDDFVRVFSSAPIDKLIITDIYDVAGREKKKIKERISSEELIKKVKRTSKLYLPMEEIRDYLRRNLKTGDVVIIMGAGDVYKLVHLIKALK